MSIETVGAALSITVAAAASWMRGRNRASAAGPRWPHGSSGRRVLFTVADKYGETRSYEVVDWSVIGTKLHGTCPVSGRTLSFPLESIRLFQKR